MEVNKFIQNKKIQNIMKNIRTGIHIKIFLTLII